VDFIIYHHPKCSKSRQALALLEEHGITPRIELYLEKAPSQTELAKLLKQLGSPVTDLFRFKEELAKELKLSAHDQRTESEWLSILANHIKLMERPIVSNGKRAVFGRPPENILALIEK